MKPYSLRRIIHPLYVLIPGLIGLAIPIYMYLIRLPNQPNEHVADFLASRSFSLWLFMISVLFSIVSIVLIPAWTLFVRLFNFIRAESPLQARKAIETICILLVLALALLSALYYLPGQVDLVSAPLSDTPNLNFQVVYVVVFLAMLPVIMGITLVNHIAAILLSRVDRVVGNEKRFFDFINDYLGYRNILQLYLLVFGVVAAMNPLTTAGLFNIYLDIGLVPAESFPREWIIVYGLVLSLALLFIYAPSFLNMMNVGRVLRDAMYPFNSLDNLEATMTSRDTLDKLLHTRVNVFDNLRIGILSLSPFITGLISTLFRT